MFMDPLGDFKTKFGAKLYTLFNGGKVGQVKDGAGKHGGEWYVSNQKSFEGEGAGVSVSVKYEWGIQRHLKEHFVAEGSITGSVGVQAEYKVAGIKIPGLKTDFTVKGGAGWNVWEFGKLGFKFENGEIDNDSYDMENAPAVIRSYAGGEIGGEILGKQVGIGGKYENSYDAYRAYGGDFKKIDGTEKGGFSGYFFGRNYISKGLKRMGANPNVAPSLKVKVGGSISKEKAFYGVDIGISLKIIIGADIKFKVGFKY